MIRNAPFFQVQLGSGVYTGCGGGGLGEGGGEYNKCTVEGMVPRLHGNQSRVKRLVGGFIQNSIIFISTSLLVNTMIHLILGSICLEIPHLLSTM